MLHCDFCGASLSEDDRSCRTCGAAVLAPEEIPALAGSGSNAQPLRQWGSDRDGAVTTQPALYNWEPASSVQQADGAANELAFGESKPSTRSYSRIRVYALAAVVAVVIVAAYTVLVGSDEQPADNDAAADVPAAESEAESAPESELEPPAVPEPGSSVPAPEESTDPAVAATAEPAQPGNSLTLTFDSPASSPAVTENAD